MFGKKPPRSDNPSFITTRQQIERIGVAPNVGDDRISYVFTLRGSQRRYLMDFSHTPEKIIDSVRETLALTQPGDLVQFVCSAANEIVEFYNVTLAGPHETPTR